MKLGKFIVGLGLGVVAGVLCAPKKGSEMVEDIKEGSKKAYDKSKNLSKDDIVDAINVAADKLKVAVEEFDVEKAKDTTKEKLTEVKTGLNDLYLKAKENESCQEVLERIDDLSKKAMDKINDYKERIIEMGQDTYEDISDEIDCELDDVKEEIDDLLEEMNIDAKDDTTGNNG